MSPLYGTVKEETLCILGLVLTDRIAKKNYNKRSLIVSISKHSHALDKAI
jgi:hypothetical protein